MRPPCRGTPSAEPVAAPVAPARPPPARPLSPTPRPAFAAFPQA